MEAKFERFRLQGGGYQQSCRYSRGSTVLQPSRSQAGTCQRIDQASIRWGEVEDGLMKRIGHMYSNINVDCLKIFLVAW